MRIVLTLHHALDRNAGAPGTTLDLAAAYQDAGHEVSIFSHDDLPEWMSVGQRKVLFPAFVAHHLRALTRHGTVDVVDASTGDTWLWARTTRRARRPLLVARSHGLEHAAHAERLREADAGQLELSWRYPLYWGGFRLWEVAASLRASDMCLFLNPHDRDYAIAELGVVAERAYVVHNAIDPVFLGRRLNGFVAAPGQPLRVAQVGTYIPRKGTAYAAAALASALGRYPQLSVTFLGTSCPPERVLEDFPSPVRDRVSVVSTYRREELPELLRGHHIQLFPSLSEGFGKTLLEGMACGLAPLATATPGPTEFISDGENGLLVPPRDSKALERALDRLVQDPQLLERLKAAAHHTAQSFSWSRLAQERLRLYEEHLKA